MTDDERLAQLENMRVFINQEIRNLKTKIKNAERPKGNHHRLTYSGLFVQTNCLVPFIQTYKDNNGSIYALADHANVSYHTIANILKGKHRWTREEVAESIMLALGLPHEFNNFALVKISRKYRVVDEPPFSHFEEE